MQGEVAARVERYLDLVDGALPSRVEGLYLVGSCALDDYQPGRSDIDFIAVVERPLSGGELDAAERAHRKLDAQSRRPWFSGIYVTWAALARDPRREGCLASHHEGRFSRARGFEANPVQWLTLRDHPLAVRGPARPRVFVDPAAVRDWTLENLRSYWALWIARRRSLLGPGFGMLVDWSIAWGVLGIVRPHYTLATGRVTSKSAAAEYARTRFEPSWHRVIEEALRLRRRDAGSLYPGRRLARRRDTLGFMSHVLASALDQKSATGLTGEPVPRSMRSGETTNRNS